MEESLIWAHKGPGNLVKEALFALLLSHRTNNHNNDIATNYSDLHIQY